MKKLIATLLSVAMMAAMFAGCASTAEESAAPAEKTETAAPAEKEEAPAEKEEAPAEEVKDVSDMKFGFVLGSREHAFYCTIEDGIKAAAEEMGFEAVVLEADLDGAIAAERIETLVVDGCDAIALSCNEPAGCTPAINDADAEGVNMFAFDCTSTETDVIKCFVGTDNIKGGEVGAEAVIQYLKDNGMTDGATVGIIAHPEPQSCIDREAGFMKVMDSVKDEMNLTVINLGSYEGDASVAETLMNDTLIQYPELACIFTVGDPACVGAMAAIKANGAATTMIGFDANPEAHEAILDPENGKIWIGDVAQDPYTIGYEIAKEMVTYQTTGSVESDTVMISPYLVDASNAIG